MKTAIEWLQDKELTTAATAATAGNAGDEDLAYRVTFDWIRRIQADARDSALEDAAKACEALHAKHCGQPTESGAWDGYTAFEHCAGTIRGMKADAIHDQVPLGNNPAVKP